jgi:ribosomal protein S18 acetylase RimI-like enzyme
MRVRRLTEEDAESLWHLRLLALETEPAAFGESPEEHRQSTVEQTASRLRAGGDSSAVLGAFEDGALIGMTGILRLATAKRRHKAVIWGVFVASDHRGTGAGRLLLEEAIRIAKAMPDVRSVGLSVNTANHAARQLYRQLGFRSWGIEPSALYAGGKHHDEEYMILEF